MDRREVAHRLLARLSRAASAAASTAASTLAIPTATEPVVLPVAAAAAAARVASAASALLCSRRSLAALRRCGAPNDRGDAGGRKDTNECMRHLFLTGGPGRGATSKA